MHPEADMLLETSKQIQVKRRSTKSCPHSTYRTKVITSFGSALLVQEVMGKYGFEEKIHCSRVMMT